MPFSDYMLFTLKGIFLISTWLGPLAYFGSRWHGPWMSQLTRVLRIFSCCCGLWSVCFVVYWMVWVKGTKPMGDNWKRGQWVQGTGIKDLVLNVRSRWMTCLALLWVRSIVKTLYCMKRTNQRPNPLKNLRAFRGDRGAAYWVVWWTASKEVNSSKLHIQEDLKLWLIQVLQV